jgi:hypothetical protein
MTELDFSKGLCIEDQGAGIPGISIKGEKTIKMLFELSSKECLYFCT